MELIFSQVNNPRTPNGGWKHDMKCGGCGRIASAYVRMDVYDGHLLICKGIKICKTCLLKGSELIDDKLLDQAKERV